MEKLIALDGCPMIGLLTISGMDAIEVKFSKVILFTLKDGECGSPYTYRNGWMVSVEKSIDNDGDCQLLVSAECRIPGEEGCWKWSMDNVRDMYSVGNIIVADGGKYTNGETVAEDCVTVD